MGLVGSIWLRFDGLFAVNYLTLYISISSSYLAMIIYLLKTKPNISYIDLSHLHQSNPYLISFAKAKCKSVCSWKKRTTSWSSLRQKLNLINPSMTLLPIPIPKPKRIPQKIPKGKIFLTMHPMTIRKNSTHWLFPRNLNRSNLQHSILKSSRLSKSSKPHGQKSFNFLSKTTISSNSQWTSKSLTYINFLSQPFGSYGLKV